MPFKVLMPDIEPWMKKLGDTATHGIDPRDIRPLGRIAVIARMGEV